MEFKFDYYEIPANTLVLAKKKFPCIYGVTHPTPKHYFDVVFKHGADFGTYGNGTIAEAWSAIQGRNYSGAAYTAFAAKLNAYNDVCVHRLAEYAAIQFATEADKELASIIAGYFGTPEVPRDIWELSDADLSAMAEHYRHIYGLTTHDFHIKCKTLDAINNYGVVKDPAVPNCGYIRCWQTYYTDAELKAANIYIPKSEGFMNRNYAEATLRRLDDAAIVFQGRCLEQLEAGSTDLHEIYDYQDGTKYLTGTSHYWDMKDQEQVYCDFLYGKKHDNI